MKIGLPLMKNTFELLTKSVFISLGLILAASVADAEFSLKKLLDSELEHSNFKWRNARYHQIHQVP